jgi:hypothetical protein
MRKGIDRRRALGLGIAAMGYAAPAFAAKGGTPGKPGGGSGGTVGDGSTGGSTGSTTTSGLQVVITHNAATYTVLASQGRDLGSFVSDIGGFTQQCIRADVPGLPMTIFFRPDLNSSRIEVVFELGRLFNATPVNLGSYSVAISNGTQLLANISVPAHYWFSRWRWQSAPRPIVGNIDALISQNLLPPYNRTTAPPSVTSAQSYTIMGLAGVTAYMPQTGERPDIGLVTEPQGQYICASDQNALATLRAQAEAAGTCPWHMRDENTGAPLDFNTYPKASWYNASVASPYIQTLASTVTLDSAHMPALAYLPYILTGDPYHLEDLQFQATWNWGTLPPQYRPSIPQSRTFAWSVRTLAQCARITPATAPSWLLPQSYWYAQLLAHRQYFEANYVNRFDPVTSIFRSTCNMDVTRDEGPTAPGGTWVDPWQEEFLASVLAWVIAMGFADWQTSFDWKIGSTIARIGNTSGWMRAMATPYRMILRATSASPTVTSWAEAWSLSQTTEMWTITDPDTWQPSDMTYLGYSRGALVYAAKLGAVGADTSLVWATGQLVKKGWRLDYKWRIGSGI